MDCSVLDELSEQLGHLLDYGAVAGPTYPLSIGFILDCLISLSGNLLGSLHTLFLPLFSLRTNAPVR